MVRVNIAILIEIGKLMLFKLKSLIRKSTIFRATQLLGRSEQKKLIIVVFLQLTSAFLDLLGVALVGVLGALAVSGFGAGDRGERVSSVLEFLNIEGNSFQTQAAFLALLVTALLTLRTVATVVIAKKILYFLGRKTAVLSSALISKLMSQSLLRVKEQTSQATYFSVTYGVEIVVLGVLGTAITTLSDIFLLVILATGMFLFSPLVAIVTFTLFGSVGFGLYRLSSTKAHQIGLRNSQLLIKSDEKISDVLNSYRELVVRNRRFFYSQEISKLRMELAETTAAMRFMPQTSKYVFELSMVFGALVVGAIQFKIENATNAVATLGVFLVAGARIAPAMMRIQQGATSIKSNLGVANPTLELIENMKDLPSISPVEDSLDLNHPGFEASVKLNNVSFSYPKSDRKTIKNIALEIPPGTKVAFVGTSGSGKTTLVDIILGILSPDSGSVLISGTSPVDAVQKWPGSVGYVPQDVVLSNGTIRENIALGFPESLISNELIWHSLERAQLADFVRTLRNGIETPAGERGSKLSGGQRQRIGIARALVTNPKLLVMDEATSALDGTTESELTKSFIDLNFGITTIVVAHRLSTIKEADLICFVKDGEILASGDFETLKRLVPDFSDQAELMGL